MEQQKRRRPFGMLKAKWGIHLEEQDRRYREAPGKLLLMVCIFLIVIFELIVVFWPLLCVSSGTGLSVWWNARGDLILRGERFYDDTEISIGMMPGRIMADRILGRLRIVLFALIVMFFADLFFSRVIVNFKNALAFVLIPQCIIIGIDLWLMRVIDPHIRHSDMFLAWSLFSTLFYLGFFFGSVVERFLFRRLAGKLLASLPYSILGFVTTLPSILLMSRERHFAIGILAITGAVSGAILGVLLATLVIYLLGHLFMGFSSTIRGILRPWQLETYSVGRAISSFFVAYIASVLLFSLWFYACYFEDISFFHIGHTGSLNWWSFVYFSFVTITTLGYGDMTPAHPFPQFLAVLETVLGIGLVVGYFAIIVNLAGQRKMGKKTAEYDHDVDMDY